MQVDPEWQVNLAGTFMIRGSLELMLVSFLVLNVVHFDESHVRGRLGVLLHCSLGRSVAGALA